MDIAAWLRDLGLQRYEQAFQDNDVDAKVLPHLTAEDLKDIGITSVGHRRSLLAAIEVLRSQTAPPEPEEPSARASPADEPSREAERRQLTVMFVDLVGSTALAARLDPEDMGEVIRGYQNAVTGEITRFEGHVAKFMGDGVLAYFGWPQAHEDEAERAVRAGLAVVAAVGRLTAPTGDPITARVGIATGLVVVGDLIGKGAAQEQAVVGETPNLAARLQAVADPGQVVVAAATRGLLGAGFDLDDLGAQAVKGFAEPIAAFRIARERPAESRFEARAGSALDPMVGRDQELALLLERWAQAKAGEGQSVLLIGEAGIGKSRLTRALLDALEPEPHIRVRYQCSSFHTESALWPVIQQLRHAAGITPTDPGPLALDKLEALLAWAGDPSPNTPLIADLLGLDGTGRYGELGLTAQVRRVRTLAALNDQLLGLATREPVLVILEDVHWVDPTTLELIEQSLGVIGSARILELLTSRPEDEPRLSGATAITRLSLNRLGRAGVEAMVRRIGGERGLDAERIEAIVARTDGVPLFVEELTKAVAESGDTAVPASLHDSLMARLDRLPAAKEIAQIAACIGREFDYPLLATVADRPEPDLTAALDQLIASELIFCRGVTPDANYTFKHALVQEAAYESLLRRRRKHLHGRIARTLPEVLPNISEQQPEILAHHFTEAGMVEDAIHQWHRAGERAIRRSADAEAVAHLSRGLALLERHPEVREHDNFECTIQTTLGPPLFAIKGFGAYEVAETYERALALSQRTNRSHEAYLALRGLWSCHLMRGEIKKALVLARRLLDLSCDQRDAVARLAAHRAIGATLALLGRFEEAKTCLEHGLNEFGQQQSSSEPAIYGEDPKVVCQLYAAWSADCLGHHDQAIEILNKAFNDADKLGHRFTSVFANSIAIIIHMQRGSVTELRALADASEAVCREHGFAQWGALADFALGWGRFALGEHQPGLMQMDRGLQAWRATGGVLVTPLFLTELADAHCYVGAYEVGGAMASEALRIAEETGYHCYKANTHRVRAELLWKAHGDYLAATKEFETAIRVACEQGAMAFQLRSAVSFARMLAMRGEQGRARDILAPNYRWFTEGSDTADLKEAKALLDELP